MLPGFAISADDLMSLGFLPYELRIGAMDIQLPDSLGCNWTTIGTVPDAPGLYAFSVESSARMAVTYVGMTEQLWMVTKGHLPRSGGARGGQRYGRPKHAGVTRKRINGLVAEQILLGRTGAPLASAPSPVGRSAAGRSVHTAQARGGAD
jgi:hypothetical protein